VDDAQWFDGASTRALTFVAHRLLAERIALVFATRDANGAALGRFPQLAVGPLGRRDARALLQSVLPAALDESVLERIVVETSGNPLAILELPSGLTPAQLAGGFGLPSASPLSTGIEQSLMRRLSKLPRDARRLLLLAAAEPVGNPALLIRAARVLGIAETVAQTLESEGFLRFDRTVTIRHPLVRSLIYNAADATERRKIHRALADATDPRIDPDRRAWHRAQAASGADEEVAAELERSAARAEARAGFAAAAAFLERAAALTPEPVRRSERALVAAQTKFRAGALDDALALLASTDDGAFGELDRARVDLLRAQIAFASTRGSDAPAMLLRAADRLAPLSQPLARETYLEALAAAMFAGRLALPGGTMLDVAMSVAAGLHPSPANGLELLLEAIATLITDGFEAFVPMLHRSFRAFDAGGMPVDEQVRWKWLPTVFSAHVWDDTRWLAICAPHVRIARETGALAELALALGQRVYIHLFAGELSKAAALVDEIQAVSEITGSQLAPSAAVALAALRGRESELFGLADRSRADVVRRGEGIALSVFDWAQAVLYNGLGRYDEALTAAVRGTDYAYDLVTRNWAMVELIEAAVRVGTPEVAERAQSRLAEMARVTQTDWALGIAARSGALLADAARAEALYVEAIQRLSRCRMAVDLARGHLLYGEWLRRHRRRVDARTQLRTAHEMFLEFGMEAFVDRARVELEATGEHARRRSAEHTAQLTPQEAQVAHLAAQGNTNREIAAQLFISPSTVEYHLTKAFRKLDVKSRTQLAHRTF
jgi:DNA-binding CsgD family transcriptional regulator